MCTYHFTEPQIVDIYIYRSLQQDTTTQQSLLSQIFTLVSARPASACNFLPLPPLLRPAPSSSTTSNSNTHTDLPTQITYRHYATLYFIVISTSTESPLALLDLIQVFVEALDRLFENVCELDLIFGFETLHAVLGEMVVGGVVVETGLERIVEGVREGEAEGVKGGLGMGSIAGGKQGGGARRRRAVNEGLGRVGRETAADDAGGGQGIGLGTGSGAAGAIRTFGWGGGAGVGLGGWG